MTYRAPVEDMMFALRHVAGLDELCTLPGLEEISPDLVEAVLEEAGKLASGVIAPLNADGDKTASVRNEDGSVTTPKGFADAYRQFVEGGWNAVPFDPEIGGQGLPWAVSMAVQEMWQSANLSFGLCPLLTQAAIEAIHLRGSDWQKETFLPKLASGEWTGTMNLTEPQAGSDLAALSCKAERKDDGTYRIRGQKIFITYGEHDMAENIVHTVLARLPDAPEGVKGISMFIVPKFLPDEAGNPGEANDVRCLSLEHKLGIHASPTCVMAYGEESEGATGWLIGEENRGLEYMFIMMNSARIAVGLQGVAVAERAYQHALSYARDRVQGTRLGDKSGQRVAIIEHPDVRRMLLDMRALTEAGRALSYYTGGLLDRARRSSDEAAAQRAFAFADLLTPVVKAWATDNAVETASTGIQIHGGMGFIEETGAAQYYRDARILPIYEGTNGIQANDLVFRKLIRDGGKVMAEFTAEMKETAAELEQSGREECRFLGGQIAESIKSLEKSTKWMLAQDAENAAASAVPYLKLFSLTCGGFILGKSALAAEKQLEAANSNQDAMEQKIEISSFFAASRLPETAACAAAVESTPARVLSMSSARF